MAIHAVLPEEFQLAITALRPGIESFVRDIYTHRSFIGTDGW
jgi:hypothetical protein